MVSNNQLLNALIPNRTHFINRYHGPDYIYLLHLPPISLCKIGLSRSNPWKRLRKIAKSVIKKYGEDAIAALEYVVMDGGYHDEQDIHNSLRHCKIPSRILRGLEAPSEWFNSDDAVCAEWISNRLSEAATDALPIDEVELRTTRRASKYSRKGTQKPLYIPD